MMRSIVDKVNDDKELESLLKESVGEFWSNLVPALIDKGYLLPGNKVKIPSKEEDKEQEEKPKEMVDDQEREYFLGEYYKIKEFPTIEEHITKQVESSGRKRVIDKIGNGAGIKYNPLELILRTSFWLDLTNGERKQHNLSEDSLSDLLLLGNDNPLIKHVKKYYVKKGKIEAYVVRELYNQLLDRLYIDGIKKTIEDDGETYLKEEETLRILQSNLGRVADEDKNSALWRSRIGIMSKLGYSSLQKYRRFGKTYTKNSKGNLVRFSEVRGLVKFLYGLKNPSVGIDIKDVPSTVREYEIGVAGSDPKQRKVAVRSISDWIIFNLSALPIQRGLGAINELYSKNSTGPFNTYKLGHIKACDSSDVVVEDELKDLFRFLYNTHDEQGFNQRYNKHNGRSKNNGHDKYSEQINGVRICDETCRYGTPILGSFEDLPKTMEMEFRDLEFYRGLIRDVDSASPLTR